jgi:hypothetical protein
MYHFYDIIGNECELLHYSQFSVIIYNKKVFMSLCENGQIMKQMSHMSPLMLA